MVIGKMMLAIKTMAMMVMISIMMLKEEKQLWVLFCEPTIDYFLASAVAVIIVIILANHHGGNTIPIT